MAQGFTGSFITSLVTIADDTTTNASYYPLWTTGTSGFVPLKVSSTKITFNPSSGNLTATTFTGALSGNASTASVAPAGTLTGATLAANVLASSLTSHGTLTSGVWNATVITVTYGGTGAASFTAYAPIFGGTTATGALQSGAVGTSGQVLTSNGAGAIATMQTKIPSKFTSSDQTITSAGSLTIAHSLGAVPSMVGVYLICQTAEQGYSINDVLDYSYMSRPNNQGVVIVPDATNLNIRFGSSATAFAALNKTTGGSSNLTNANWKVRFFAVLFN